jgi:SAM-dependent methyltransferase
LSDPLSFVCSRLPAPPARVLEAGAGDGALARQLIAEGYDVLAIDPDAHGEGVVELALADLDEPDSSFDAAVAVLSLHHVHPLHDSCARLAAVLRPGAPLVIDEFDVARFDDRAESWLLEQRRSLGKPADHTAAQHLADLREHLHPVSRIAAALEPWFELGELELVSYLYRWDLDDSLEAEEERLIAADELPAVGVRFVAARQRPR